MCRRECLQSGGWWPSQPSSLAHQNYRLLKDTWVLVYSRPSKFCLMMSMYWRDVSISWERWFFCDAQQRGDRGFMFVSEHTSKSPCERGTDVRLKEVIYLASEILGSINKLYYLSREIKY